MSNFKSGLLMAGATLAFALATGVAFAQATSAPAGAGAPVAQTMPTEPLDLEVGREHTQILLSWSHNGVTTTYGVIREFHGTVHLDPVTVENSKVEVSMDINSLDTFFDTRTNIFKSARFFNIEMFPEATFVSTSVVRTGDNTADITGDLTILGNSRPVTLKTQFNKAGEYMGVYVVGFTAEASIMRADWGLTDLTPNTGPEVKIVINAELVKPKV